MDAQLGRVTCQLLAPGFPSNIPWNSKGKPSWLRLGVSAPGQDLSGSPRYTFIWHQKRLHSFLSQGLVLICETYAGSGSITTMKTSMYLDPMHRPQCFSTGSWVDWSLLFFSLSLCLRNILLLSAFLGEPSENIALAVFYDQGPHKATTMGCDP